MSHVILITVYHVSSYS